MKEIPLTKGYIAQVDDSDYDALSQFCWHTKIYKGKPYAARSAYVREAWLSGAASHTKTVLMHRQLLNAKPEEDVDHENRNTLDNQRYNLRVCSRSQNTGNQKIRSTNTSGFKGVFLKKGRILRPWCATICVNYEIINLGYFNRAEDAALAYDQMAIKHFGVFARINFPVKEREGGL